MQHTISIDCPPEILLGLHLDAEGFADYLKKPAAIGLFKEGKLSSGTAANWLGESGVFADGLRCGSSLAGRHGG